MTRPLAAVVLLALPAVSSAQFGPPVLNGNVVTGYPIASGATALFPVQSAVPPTFSVGGGSMSAYPQVWVPSGNWGGAGYPWPVYPIFFEPVPNPVGIAPSAADSSRNVLSGLANATLVVQMPAAAEVWVGGKKVEGKPAAEWTLTSPALTVGESHTFELKGRWKAGGKTFEVSRSVAVSAGDRSRSMVIAGTEVKE